MEMREKIARALAPYMAVFPLEPDLSDAEAMWDARTPTEDQAARRAVQAVLTAIGETHVLVPRSDLEQVVEVANRNEQCPEGDRLAAMLAAVKEGE